MAIKGVDHGGMSAIEIGKDFDLCFILHKIKKDMMKENPTSNIKHFFPL